MFGAFQYDKLKHAVVISRVNGCGIFLSNLFWLEKVLIHKKKIGKMRYGKQVLKELRMTDTGRNEGSPALNKSPFKSHHSAVVRGQHSHTCAEPHFHTGLPQLATSSQRRRDHCRPLSCRCAPLDCCENYSDSGVVGTHVSQNLQLWMILLLLCFTQKSIHGNLCFMAYTQQLQKM